MESFKNFLTKNRDNLIAILLLIYAIILFIAAISEVFELNLF